MNKSTELKKKKTVNMENEEISTIIDSRDRAYEPHQNINSLYDKVSDLLDNISDNRIKRIFELRYSPAGKNTFKDIGAELGITSQSVINLHKKGIKFLKARLKKS